MTLISAVTSSVGQLLYTCSIVVGAAWAKEADTSPMAPGRGSDSKQTSISQDKFCTRTFLPQNIAIEASGQENDKDDRVAKTAKSVTSEADAAHKKQDGTCEVYLAPSTIPGAGLGLFTFTPRKKDDAILHGNMVLQTPDLLWHRIFRHIRESGRAIPLSSDEMFHVSEEVLRPRLPMDSYGWGTIGAKISQHDNALIPGLGMVSNFHAGQINIDSSSDPHVDSAGLHRATDPGAGAFSPFYDAKFGATRDIPAGSELFIDYGEQYFGNGRKHMLDVPLAQHFDKADQILQRFWVDTERGYADLTDETWQQLRKNVTSNEKRLMAALPSTLAEAIRVKEEKGGRTGSMHHALRSPDWLKENGWCIDAIQPGLSPIPQAGRGAFAARLLKKGDVVAPVPLLQLSREDMLMYYQDEGGFVFQDGQQLMLNYCYGHPKSSLLLFPYSPGFGFINHGDGATSATEPNIRLQWTASPISHSNWLNKTAQEVLLEPHSGLIMEIVAFRNIQPGEEILLDFGDQWQTAWEQHIHDWKPYAGAKEVISASAMNEECPHILSIDEQEITPYPENVKTVCYISQQNINEKVSSHHQKVPRVSWRSDPQLKRTKNARDCEALLRKKGINKPLSDDSARSVRQTKQCDQIADTYAVLVNLDNQEGQILVDNIPRDMIEFVDRPYTSDQFLPNGFRHEMGLPGGLFPESWMDLECK
mmetsp:Transcript_10744/g.31801  ORF Transcript_10744/g.31801 Transcript_10744/m.31801 type:complete len:703 (-) Transcript_10744:22-2130(-)